MATLPTIPEVAPAETSPPAPLAAATLLVCLPTLAADSQAAVVDQHSAAFGGESIMVAGAAAEAPSIQAVEYVQPRSQLGWVLAAGDYAAAAALAQQHEASVVLLLGADVLTLPAESLRTLVQCVRDGADLAVPRYPIGANEALVTSALLYPLTRALFATDIRFPLPVDAALSPRLLQRLAALATRTASQGAESLLWPVAEASIAGFKVRQVETPPRTLPPPPESDLNTLLAAVAGSLFADIESRAVFWQRGRAFAAAPAAGVTPEQALGEADHAELAGMIDGFRLASNNLGELWSIVLPPQTLLALKKLARVAPVEFAFDPGLWARIVYDFALAFHRRTLNRGHLLGAMTPLYLAWVASHIRSAGDDAERAARLNEATAQAFESEKSYFVSRWRWPDRFNP